MNHAHASCRWSTSCVALAMLAVLACDDPEPTTEVTIDDLTNGACNATYRNKKTSNTSAYSSYACAPSLSLPGGEYVASVTINVTGDVVISAKNYTDYPFITVLNDTGTGVDPSNCVTGNFYSVRFAGTAGQKIYVVVDGLSAGSMDLDLRIGCAVSTEATSALCSDGFDNDANQQADCADPACAAFCPTEMCTPSGVLGCGDSLVYGTTDGFGTTSTLTTYACASDWTPNSSEHAYTFTPTTSGWVNFTVSEAGDYPMLYVLDDSAGGCSPNNCVAFNYYSNKFYATAGKTYHLVVDGTGGTGKAYNYLVSLVCDPPATETTCDNDIDDDGNGLIDCSDPVCKTTPVCQQPTCAPIATLDCNSTLVAGDTAASGSTDAIRSYACAPNVSLGGPERGYQLGPFTQSRPVVVTLSNESSYGMISILEETGGGCEPASCVTENYGSVRFNAKAGKTYYAVVEGQGAPSISYDISVVCQVPANEAGLCTDNIDNDGNRLIDCLDPACATASACNNTCTAAGTLTDTTRLLAGSTSASGSTSTLSSYSCATDSMPGREYVYRYVPSTTGTVLFTLSDLTNYAGIAVLHATANSGCSTSTCIDFQYYSVLADVKASDTYYIVVDGMQAGSLDYKISVIPNPPLSETVCTDNIDNDGNFLIDTADPVCP